MIITSPTSVPLLSADEFVAAAIERYGQSARVIGDTGTPNTDQAVDVTRPGEPGFQIDHDRSGDSIRCDGMREQNAEVAAWIRSLLPADFPRLIAFDQAWTWHVDLTHGITAEEVLANEISHDDPSWGEGDPDLW